MGRQKYILPIKTNSQMRESASDWQQPQHFARVEDSGESNLTLQSVSGCSPHFSPSFSQDLNYFLIDIPILSIRLLILKKKRICVLHLRKNTGYHFQFAIVFNTSLWFKKSSQIFIKIYMVARTFSSISRPKIY